MLPLQASHSVVSIKAMVKLSSPAWDRDATEEETRLNMLLFTADPSFQGG